MFNLIKQTQTKKQNKNNQNKNLNQFHKQIKKTNSSKPTAWNAYIYIYLMCCKFHPVSLPNRLFQFHLGLIHFFNTQALSGLYWQWGPGHWTVLVICCPVLLLLLSGAVYLPMNSLPFSLFATETSEPAPKFGKGIDK